MKKLEWKLEHRMGEEPWGHRIVSGDLDILVHRHIDYEPNVWLCSVRGIMEKRVLLSPDLEKAKAEAFSVIETHAKRILNSLDGIRRAT